MGNVMENRDTDTFSRIQHFPYHESALRVLNTKQEEDLLVLFYCYTSATLIVHSIHLH